MENFRKRSEREIDNARKFAIERFAQELVPVGDALEAGINAGAAEPGTALLEGAQATLRQLYRAFDKGGIKVIDPAPGPALRPAVAGGHDGPGERGSAGRIRCWSVIQKGYSLNGRLLRPARVIVSQGAGRQRQLKNGQGLPK